MVAVVALVSAAVGGITVLGLVRAAGWLDTGRTETVAVRSPASVPVRTNDSPPAVHSTARPLAGNQFDPALIYARRTNGVVLIETYGSDPHSPTSTRGQGSGFIVSKDGYILTNSHVITQLVGGRPAKAAAHVYVEFTDRERVRARVVGWDPFNDVGVLRVDAKQHRLEPVPLGDSSRVVVGEPVAAIGSPFGNRNSLSVGVVAATRRSIESLTSEYEVPDAIQTDAPINHGNSAGPLFNARGEVIGINAQIRSESGRAEGVGFAIPINSARRSLEELIATGRVEYPYVGVYLEDITPRRARQLGYPPARGALVERVADDSPADRAGLRGGSIERFLDGIASTAGGDLIVAVNGEPVTSADDLVRTLAERFDPGDVAAFTIFRGDDRRTVRIRLEERPTVSR